MINTQKEIARRLLSASAAYGRAGLALFRVQTGIGKNSQAAIGNIAIAIELLLKATIAKKNLLLLYKDLPLELRCALAAPKAIPKSFRKTFFEIELNASSYKSLELDETISTYGVFYPESKHRLNSHLRFLSRHRNTCVHSILADCREYEVERTVFLFLSLVEHVQKNDPKLVAYIQWGDETENKRFLKRFDEERLNRVHGKVEAAREKAKQLIEAISLEPTGWDTYPVKCPVCGSDGLLSGETHDEIDLDEDGVQTGVTLTFNAETFECEQCGLKLDDYDELNIAAIDTDLDRSDEESKWIEDNYSFNSYNDFF